MPGGFGEYPEVERAILLVPQVRGISTLRLLPQPDGGTVVVTRVGLSPALRLAEVVLAIAEVDANVRHADANVKAVFVEPDIAADSATPTETIVIRALD